MRVEVFKKEHYTDLATMIGRHEQRVPLYDEIKHYGLVAIEGSEIVGFIWANVGTSTTAFIDHLIVDKDHRQKDLTVGRSVIAMNLGVKMLSDLCNMGITRLVATVMDDIYGPCLAGFYERIGLENVNCMCISRGNISDCVNKLRGLSQDELPSK